MIVTNKRSFKKIKKKFKKEYKELLDQIEKFEHIAIFRHLAPDFDALGTQFGLATFLKDNFPNKEIVVLGDNHVTFTGRIYPETDKISDSWFDNPFLAIICDVGDAKRIADPRFAKATFKVKIDHHPATDDIFDLSILDVEAAAASEIVSNFLFSIEKKYTITTLAAQYLYSALVGDSGRFMFSSTSTHTFEIASKLIGCGLEIKTIYEKMYEKSVSDLDIMKFVLNNFKITDKGVAYYILTQKDLDALHIPNERGKENVNLFSNIKGVNIWCSITEDVTVPCFRISLRSRNYVINEVAAKYEGGGHAYAAGCQIKDLSDLNNFIADLEKVIEGK